MLEAIKFAHEHIKTKFRLNCVCKLLLVKRSSYYEGEREDEAIYKVKAASYDKIMLLLAKVQQNKNVQQHLKK
jgi:hypothetical protein